MFLNTIHNKIKYTLNTIYMNRVYIRTMRLKILWKLRIVFELACQPAVWASCEESGEREVTSLPTLLTARWESRLADYVWTGQARLYFSALVPFNRKQKRKAKRCWRLRAKKVFQPLFAFYKTEWHEGNIEYFELLCHFCWRHRGYAREKYIGNMEVIVFWVTIANEPAEPRGKACEAAAHRTVCTRIGYELQGENISISV